MRRYAEGTTVAPGKTIEEIQSLLIHHGADAFAQHLDVTRGIAGFMFTLRGLAYRVVMRLPDPADDELTHTPVERRRRTDDQVQKLWEHEIRRRWRSLALLVKAKLVAVDEGIVALEEEFLPYVVLASGQSIAEEALPRLQEAVRCGQMPTPSLLGLPVVLALPEAGETP